MNSFPSALACVFSVVPSPRDMAGVFILNAMAPVPVGDEVLSPEKSSLAQLAIRTAAVARNR